MAERPVPRGTSLDYHVVDVFTDVAFTGNPLAVVLGSDGLSARQLQALAREFHLSETAFPQEASEAERAAGADYRLRIFTPEVELPFAGHPSIGTAWLLHRLGLVRAGVVRQACGAGVLPLDVPDGDGAVVLTGGPPSADAAIDPGAALAAVGLGPADRRPVPAVRAGTGLDYVVVAVTAEALTSAEPDLAALRAVFTEAGGATGIYLVSWDHPDTPPSRVRARMFAGDVGVAEDAATGSAALALGAALPSMVAAPDGRWVVDVTQGVEMGRPSRLHVEVDVVDGRAGRVRVGGQVVPVAGGRVVVPD